MRGHEYLPTDSDDGDIFEFTMPERSNPELRHTLGWIEDQYYYGTHDDYLSDEYWDGT
jgi:hypothetical protein